MIIIFLPVTIEFASPPGFSRLSAPLVLPWHSSKPLLDPFSPEWQTKNLHSVQICLFFTSGQVGKVLLHFK